tara:strand:- start:48695 stop:49294 length:600 start_codon:yes stop_codon:yes gene_type:complete
MFSISFSLNAKELTCLDKYKNKLEDIKMVLGEEYQSKQRQASYSLMVGGLAFTVLGMPFIGLAVAGSGAAMPVKRDKEHVEAQKQRRLINTLMDMIDPNREGHASMKDLVASTAEVDEACRPRFEDVYSGLKSNICNTFKEESLFGSEIIEAPKFNRLVAHIKEESQCLGANVNDSNSRKEIENNSQEADNFGIRAMPN